MRPLVLLAALVLLATPAAARDLVETDVHALPQAQRCASAVERTQRADDGSTFDMETRTTECRDEGDAAGASASVAGIPVLRAEAGTRGASSSWERRWESQRSVETDELQAEERFESEERDSRAWNASGARIELLGRDAAVDHARCRSGSASHAGAGEGNTTSRHGTRHDVHAHGSREDARACEQGLFLAGPLQAEAPVRRCEEASSAASTSYAQGWDGEAPEPILASDASSASSRCETRAAVATPEAPARAEAWASEGQEREAACQDGACVAREQAWTRAGVSLTADGALVVRADVGRAASLLP